MTTTTNSQTMASLGHPDHPMPEDVAEALRDNGLDRGEAVARDPSHSVSRPSELKSESVRRRRSKSKVSLRSIELACDEFFRSRGMPRREKFN